MVESIATKTTSTNSMEHKNAQDLLNRLINNAEKATGDNKLFEMWSNPKKYKKHVEKRLREQEIIDELDYQNKTFNVLANAPKITIAIPNKGDMISGKMQVVVDEWVVLLGKKGEIVTSYPFDKDSSTFEQNEIQAGSKIYEHSIDGKTRKILKKLFDVS